MTFDKRQKSVHRYDIADTRGRLSLTVPISHSSGHRPTWGDITVSTHGQWWNVHRTTLESAYGRTPFFEYYRDRFAPLFDATRYAGDTPVRLVDIITDADAAIRDILHIETRLSVTPPDALPIDRVDAIESTNVDRVTPIKSSAFDRVDALHLDALPTEYYQIRSNTLGFIPDLSALDAIFNLGPEAALLIR
jgi:hypothetical protein